MNETNMTQVIIETLNSIFSQFFTSIDTNVYSLLDELVFIGQDFLEDSYLEKLLGTSSSNGLLLIANSLLIGFILYYAISLLLSHITFSPQEHPLKFFFKIVLLGIFLNSCYSICEGLLFFTSSFSSAIREVGESILGKEICFSSLIQELNDSLILGENSFNIFSFEGLLKGFMSFGLFQLLFSYALRYVMLKVFLLLSPFAFLTISNAKTSWIFKSWARCLFSLLFTQVFISIILLITFSADFSDNLFSQLLYVGCIYALIRANHSIRELIGGISTSVDGQLLQLKSFLK